MPPPAATQAAARLWTARVARSSFSSLFLMRSAASRMRPNNASHCKLFLSSIPTHSNRVGLSLENLAGQWCGPQRPIHRPEKRKFRKFVTPREEWGGAPSCWKYIRLRLSKGTSSKRWGNSSCTNLRYDSPVKRPSKMKGPITYRPELHTTHWHWKVVESCFQQ